MPPRLVQNDESWLAFTDLVFVDPVGTGFSRVIEQDDEAKDSKARTTQKKGDEPDPKEYFGYKRDLESLSRVHRPLALGPRSLGLARLHRRRELRRLSRRAARAHAPGDGRHRAQRRDPDLARARDLDARVGRLRRPLAGSTSLPTMAARGRAPRPLARVRRAGRRSRRSSARPRRSRRATTRRS